MLDERTLDDLRAAHAAIAGAHRPPEIRLEVWQVATALLSGQGDVHALIDALAPEAGWWILIGAASSVDVFWPGAPRHAVDPATHCPADGEFHAGARGSLALRHEPGAGWRATWIASAEAVMPTVLGRCGVRPERLPVLLQEHRFLTQTALFAKRGAAADAPKWAVYDLAWQTDAAEGDEALVPLLQAFRGFAGGEE